MAFRRIAQILVEEGVLTKMQAAEILEEQKGRFQGELFGSIAMQLGLVNEEQLAHALATQFNMQLVDLHGVELPQKIIDEVNQSMAQLYRVIPVALNDNVLTVAMSEPQNLHVLDELRTFLGYDVQGVVATETEIQQALERYYPTEETIEQALKEISEDIDMKKAAEQMAKGKFDLSEETALADSAPVRKLLNMILLMAVRDQASDVHFEPFEHEFKIRMKADGVLYEMVPPPRHLAVALVTRIKVMANLDIAERRLPQDGRIELTVGGHPVDLRVAVCPTLFGESVVIRLLDRSVVNLDLNAVGMDQTTLKRFRQVIKKPNGICLVTGPTGSGKTTTLYSSLCELNKVTEKIITTEDPVEYDIDGIVQVPIDPNIQVTFANCLRAILRQDPDIILVGEIRDTETAEIAVQAALTGHLVFSTLHTNDAPSTITRLRDMHVPPFLIAATVEAVLAQRLLRRVCTACRKAYTPKPEALADIGIKPEDAEGKKFYFGEGCERCNNSGYKGRIGVFELMICDEDLREMIMTNASVDEMRELARTKGMTPLRDSAIDLLFDGVTSFDEVMRETVLDF